MTRSSRRLKKQSSDDGEEGRQTSENAQGLPGTQARHATLEEEVCSKRETQAAFSSLFPEIIEFAANSYIEEDLSRPGTPAESQADASCDEEEDFSFPKRTARHTVRTTPSPVDLRNSFSALTDNEEELENTPALLQPTFKDRLPPIFIKITPSQEHLDIIKSLIYPETRTQIKGPYLKIVSKTRQNTPYF